jgi:hypothetical protein
MERHGKRGGEREGIGLVGRFGVRGKGKSEKKTV